MSRKLVGVALISFVASIAGIIISSMLLKEDVISTAHTIFEYFPMTYGVTPSTSWEGAVILGIFITVLQIISMSIASSNRFNISLRVFAGAVWAASAYFDNWTDVVFRSGNLTGNKQIATITTLAFYTFGSEIAESLSWIVVVNVWRPAISDLMWGWAKFLAGFQSISGEWKRFAKAASNREFKDREIEEDRKPQYKPTYRPLTPRTPSSPNEPSFPVRLPGDKPRDFPYIKGGKK